MSDLRRESGMSLDLVDVSSKIKGRETIVSGYTGNRFQTLVN